MSKLPPLNSIKQCPKCLLVINSMFTYKYIAVMIDLEHIEFMERTCPRCGYSWSEQCADAPCSTNPNTDNRPGVCSSISPISQAQCILDVNHSGNHTSQVEGDTINLWNNGIEYSV